MLFGRINASCPGNGTLWVEHRFYTLAAFALDRLRELVPAHPDWKNREPFKAVLTGDRKTMSKFSEADWETILAVTHRGMSTEAFAGIAKAWLAQARAPRWHGPSPIWFTSRCSRSWTICAPMASRLSQPAYGIPPEQIEYPDEIRVPGWQADIDARSTTVLHRGFAGSRLFGSPHHCDRILASFVGRAAAFLSRNRPGLPLVAARRHLLLQLGWMAALDRFRPDTRRFGDYRRARYLK